MRSLLFAAFLIALFGLTVTLVSRAEPDDTSGYIFNGGFEGDFYPVEAGQWVATLVELTTADLASPAGAAVAVDAHGSQTTVTVSWPDGTATTSRLAHPGSPANR